MSDLGDLIMVGLLSQKDGLGLTANEARAIAEDIASHITGKIVDPAILRVLQERLDYRARAEQAEAAITDFLRRWDNPEEYHRLPAVDVLRALAASEPRKA